MTLLHYDLLEGPAPDAPFVVLSAGLGGLAGYWAPQMTALRRRYRVLAYDQRGTGRNRQDLPDGYAIADMAAEVAAMLDAARIERCHFVGHALGGLVGLALAQAAPERLRALVVVNGWAAADAHTRRCFETRLALLGGSGPAAYVRAQPLFLYPAAWMAGNAARLEAEDANGLAHFQGEATLRRRIDALLRFDARPLLPEIRTPTLLVASQDDMLVAPQQSDALAAGLPNATLHTLPWGGHAVNVTAPDAFESVMMPFLAAHD
ncbi:MAG: pyrimidine utilization protein D [Rhodospirillales bacterium]|nr:pyrimidine utilization protein D [Rhodospirillales bacterium]